MNPKALIIGAGPVGLTMALELSRYGVPVRIVDKSAARTDKSKAIVLWSRTMELLERAGLTEKLIAAGFRVNGANIVAGSQQIAHVPLSDLPTPYPFALMLPQSDTERLLEAQLATHGVQVERQTELRKFETLSTNIIATVARADGQTESITADWLLGCDGAHSAVRHQLAMGFEGDTLPSDWVLADLHLAGVPGKADELHMFWHADGVLAIFPMLGNRYRVIADIGDAVGETPRPDPTLLDIQALVDQRGPAALRARRRIGWPASASMNARSPTIGPAAFSWQATPPTFTARPAAKE